MKCDELKARLAYFSEDDYERGTHKICAKVSDCGYDRKNDWWSYAFEDEVYLKSDVDNAIAELKQKLEDAKASAYAESVDAGMENRRLKRALYKACANWAHHRVFLRFKTNEKAWENVERKCRAKAEEYR